MENKFKNVYILATEDGQKGVIETLENWGGEARDWKDKNVRQGEIWFIDNMGNIDCMYPSSGNAPAYTQIHVGQKPLTLDINIASKEIKRLERIIKELNNQIKAQAKKNTEQRTANNSLHTLYNNLKWETEKKSKKPPMYRGDIDRYDEVIKALEDMGGINTFNNKGHNDECCYYIGEANTICFANFKATRWLLEQVFELKELPPKKIELIEGEFYKCKGTPNDTCIFIYKNTNEYDTSFLCGIHMSGDFIESSIMHFSTIDNILPATQEQKEILLKRIDDEGYTYNKEKVTLEKKKEVIEFSLISKEPFICRLNTLSRWIVDIYRGYNESKTYPVLGYRYFYDKERILPLEGNEHLINTTNMPDKEYVFKP